MLQARCDDEAKPVCGPAFENNASDRDTGCHKHDDLARKGSTYAVEFHAAGHEHQDRTGQRGYRDRHLEQVEPFAAVEWQADRCQRDRPDHDDPGKHGFRPPGQFAHPFENQQAVGLREILQIIGQAHD